MAKMAASSQFANVSDEEIEKLNISAVPKSMQYATKYGPKIFKGKDSLFELISLFWNCTKSNSINSWSWNSQQVNHNRNS